MNDGMFLHNKQYEKILEYIDKNRTSLSSIQIGDKLVGMNNPTFIIAEAACNHMCSIQLAKEMIHKAVEAGADSIKFQTYKAETLVTKNATAFWGEKEISQLEYYKNLDRFVKKDYAMLFNHAKEKGIIAFSSPFDFASASMLNDLEMPVIKVASCDITNTRYLEKIAKFGKPIILSTGASTIEEIDRAVLSIFEAGNFQLFLLACTLSYPTKNKDANLNRIRSLIKRYSGITIGLSDHTYPDANMVIDPAAVAIGARLVEKHFTLDRSMTGSGHFFAMEPDDLLKMRLNIRLVEEALGSGDIGVSSSELKAWKSARRGLVANIFIPKNTKLTEDMLGVKRPATGLCPSNFNEIIGKETAIDIQADTPLTIDMLKK